jgi:TolB protein
MSRKSTATALALVALTLLGAVAAHATAPGKNGRLVFRRYLDASRTSGALFTVNPNGSKLVRVTRPPRGVLDTEPDWSPNGARLAFERRLPCPAGGPRDGLDNACTLVYTARRDGTRLRSLVPCAFDARLPFPRSCVGVHTPAWSPDGSKIAFRYSLVNAGYAGSLGVSGGIWVVNANGTGLRQVTQLEPGTSWDYGPQWSPDGTKLVFFRADLARRADAVFTVNADGTGLFQVTPWELNAGDGPDWSPDGQWLLFRGEPADGSSNVYKAHPDGTGLTNLTRQTAGGFHYLSSSFSPNGSMIATARTPGTGPQRAADVVVMRANGSNIRPVVRSRLWDSAADWGTAPLR